MVDTMIAEKSPSISVVMSLYNSERYLREAIDSILTQTLTEFEFIIIDDGSTDGSLDIVKSYKDSRIHFIQQTNAGLPAALNAAIRHARAGLIARMDPDDIAVQDRFAQQYDYLLRHPEIVIVGSAAMCIDAAGEQLAGIKKAAFQEVGNLVLPESPCIHPSVLFRRSTFEQVGGYPEGMRYGGEDAVLFNQMLAFGAVGNIPEPLMLYRVTPTSMSQKSRQFNKLLRQRVYKEVRGEPVSKAEEKALSDAYRHPKGGSFGYHLYVGKLFLGGAGQAVRARSYFLKALRDSPLSLYAWGCLISSFMPLHWQKTLRSCLQKVKICVL